MPHPPLQPIPADRILGCLAGGAVGDALGYQVEFHTYDQILLDRGPEGVTGPKEGEPLLASDDTQMTLFTGEAIVAALEAPAPRGMEVYREAFRLAYLDWLSTQARGSGPGRAGTLAMEPGMRARRAPGNTCLGALVAGGHGSTGEPINGSKGCGGVMRVAPIGLVAFPAENMKQATQIAFDIACEAAAVTHGHPQGWLPAGAMAALVRQLAGGVDLLEATMRAMDLVQERKDAPYEDRKRVSRLMDLAFSTAALNPNLKPRSLETLFGGGWTGEEALAIGLFAAAAGDDFQDAVCVASNHSGDSDSTASIAGQLLGARDGMACVPDDWWQAVDLRPLVLRSAESLHAAARRA